MAEYVVTELQPPGEQTGTRAHGVNGFGVAVGETWTATSPHHACSWTAGVPTWLDLPQNDIDSYANAINDRGLIVGSLVSKTHVPPYESDHAYVYDNGVFHDLHQAANGKERFARSVALDVNRGGYVVGLIGDPDNRNDLPFILHYPVGTVEHLPLPTGMTWGQATAINDRGKRGEVVAQTGDLFPASTPRQIDGVEYPVSGPLAVLGTTTAVSDINDAGYVVGIHDFEGIAGGAFRYDPASATFVNLGALEALNHDTSIATAINAEGDVVGYSASSADYLHSRAFLWTETDGMVDLNEHLLNLGWVLISATDINNAGQIVGEGWLYGAHRGFLLTPSSQVPAPHLQSSDLQRWEALLRIVYGIVQGAAGLATTPSGVPIHVPPREPVTAELSPDQADAILGVALTALSDHVHDPRGRTDLASAGLRLARRALQRLELTEAEEQKQQRSSTDPE